MIRNGDRGGDGDDDEDEETHVRFWSPRSVRSARSSRRHGRRNRLCFFVELHLGVEGVVLNQARVRTLCVYVSVYE